MQIYVTFEPTEIMFTQDCFGSLWRTESRSESKLAMLMKSKLTETDLSAVVKASRESRQSTENVDCSSKLSPQNRYRVPRVRSNWRHLGIMLNKMKKEKINFAHEWQMKRTFSHRIHGTQE